MKFVFALGILVFCMHVCSPAIVGIPGKRVGRHPKPLWGECFYNDAILCEKPGVKVQYDGENCVDCTCQNDSLVLCCNVEPYPFVCSPKYCSVWLNPDTCYYEKIKTVKFEDVPKKHYKLWRGACRVEGYEIANLTVLGFGEDFTWEPEDDKHKPPQNINSKKNKKQ